MSIAFAYIESAVVVYLRAIFYPDGFTFPMPGFGEGPIWAKLLLTEIGREAATLVLILTACHLAGKNRRQRFAYFLVIFAIWDIFYYIWLKVLLNWPASIMDWDVLFLIPMIWASPVIAPVIVSVIMLGFAVVILYRDSIARPIKVTTLDWLGFSFTGLVIVISFCIAGLHMGEPDYNKHFHWTLFAIPNLAAVTLFLKCAVSKQPFVDSCPEN